MGNNSRAVADSNLHEKICPPYSTAYQFFFSLADIIKMLRPFFSALGASIPIPFAKRD
jgi:hypothetical protein